MVLVYNRPSQPCVQFYQVPSIYLQGCWSWWSQGFYCQILSGELTWKLWQPELHGFCMQLAFSTSCTTLPSIINISQRMLGIMAITRLLLPNSVREDNFKNVAFRFVVLVHDMPSEPCVQYYQVSIYLKGYWSYEHKLSITKYCQGNS